MNRILNLRWLALLLPLSLCACTTTGILPMTSTSFERPSNPSTSFRVVYLDNNLSAQTEKIQTKQSLSAYGYEAIGPTLKKRIPEISAQLGLKIEMDPDRHQFYTQKGADEERARALQKNTGTSVLILQTIFANVLSGSVNSVPTGGNVALVLNADFIDTRTNTLVWNGKFDVKLGAGFPAPVWVDGNFVDKLMTVVIAQLQADGIVGRIK